MNKRLRLVTILLAITTLVSSVGATAKKGTKTTGSDKEIADSAKPVLWRSPGDIRSRNLFYGSGGEAHAPHTTYTFEKEDMEGTSPKFIVRDENGVRWKVKMGHEARPETVASRFVWAVGYSTNEDYFLPELPVEGMPEHLHRGQQFIEPQGTAHNVRLKRYLDGEKKVGIWKWSDNPFSSTRELNGLRVIMALINNWDTKDINNAIYYEKHPEGVSRARKHLHGERPWGNLRNHGSLVEAGGRRRKSPILQRFQVCAKSDASLCGLCHTFTPHVAGYLLPARFLHARAHALDRQAYPSRRRPLDWATPGTTLARTDSRRLPRWRDTHPMKWKVSAKWWKVELPS